MQRQKLSCLSPDPPTLMTDPVEINTVPVAQLVEKGADHIYRSTVCLCCKFGYKRLNITAQSLQQLSRLSSDPDTLTSAPWSRKRGRVAPVWADGGERNSKVRLNFLQKPSHWSKEHQHHTLQGFQSLSSVCFFFHLSFFRVKLQDLSAPTQTICCTQISIIRAQRSLSHISSEICLLYLWPDAIGRPQTTHPPPFLERQGNVESGKKKHCVSIGDVH